MIMIGLRMIQIFVNRQIASAASSATWQLNFSNPANSGYRGFYF